MAISQNQSQLSFRHPVSPRYSDDASEIHYGAVLLTIWRGKWLIAILSLLFAVAGGYYANVLATPLYRATAVVILQTQQDQIVDLQSVAAGMTGDSTEVNSELEVLRSRGLLGKVVDQLELVKDPEFNASLRPPHLGEQAVGWIKSAVGLPVGTDTVDAPLPSTIQQRADVVSSVLEKMSVSNVRNSLVFNISISTQSPWKSAEIADTIAQLYIRDQIDVKYEATEQATRWLTGRVAELRTALEVAERKISDFSAATQLISPEGLQSLERQIKHLRDRIRASKKINAALIAQLTLAEQAPSRSAKAAALDDGQLSQLLSGLENGTASAAAFDAWADRIVRQIRLDIAESDAQWQALTASAQTLNQQIAQQGEDLISLQQLSREAEATRSLYEHFLLRLKETSVQQGIQKADGRVLSHAVVPFSPFFPRKTHIMTLALILGAIVGAGIVLLREMRNDSLRTASDLEAETGHVVLGQIPLLPGTARKNVLNYLSDKPASEAAEAVRNLRTSLMLPHVRTPPQVIVSTSALPGEGKTTTALALAHNLLGLGKKVLLIDGDMRRSTLQQSFSDLPGGGILSVLSGAQTLQQAVHRSPDFGADILAGGNDCHSAADHFASEPFEDLIAEARATYDAVIIDTPPVLAVPDARIIAEQSDAIIFTVRWDSTGKQQIEEAIRLFRHSNQRITGMVLNQINPKGMKRYGYRGKFDAYRSCGTAYYAN
ncbi:polysaccharide biosynthesis tyrosine autokinase [Sulfitobacter sp. TSTF-M16]|uniref:non-specific protein-tyrosine kinase n=1 Tax=Sulfitobacter aestuariivivens TaxID=2766981 RepID=A0A927HFI6_9RHOB|nr:polysaccharide biosynthesis tyrosine autokinase [Sulfitobacter aestuariivivens]MBD3664976.1 polysaccharide biosynthesis tyrosine autokinase [Sulfitobacter aestuariivivens]